MTKQELENIWFYFLSIEEDISNTSRFVEPTQKEVYSFEFLKLIILACSEIESTFKYMCTIIKNGEKYKRDISEYKSIILGKYPKITQAVVRINRTLEMIKPFENWNNGKLFWWDAYQNVKHSRANSFSQATYWNAVHALSALYILIFYLAKVSEISLYNIASTYIYSDYSHQLLACAPPKKLPDFEAL
jgi:hypothetical protein